jgi:hypothetical protein
LSGTEPDTVSLSDISGGEVFQLMQVIHGLRPDLQTPEGWV